jgi:hypothetical protein
MSEIQEQIDQFLQDNKITYSHKFVPFSISRNAKEKEPTLNWKVELTNEKGSIFTDYQKGIGHLDFNWVNGFRKVMSIDQDKATKSAVYDAIEKGIHKDVTVGNKGDVKVGFKNKPFPHPTIYEVLTSLLIDAQAIDFPSYESWANEYGYESDSRKGEKTYNACREHGAQLLQIFGSREKMNQLQEMLYDLENEPVSKAKPKM